MNLFCYSMLCFSTSIPMENQQNWDHCTKNEVFVKDFFSKCDQILSLLKKSLMENSIFVCSGRYKCCHRNKENTEQIWKS